MPFVNVKVIEGVFSDEQKQEMITKLTDAMVSIEGENMRQVTWVAVEEVRSGEWGIGGQTLTTDAVKACLRVVRFYAREGFVRTGEGVSAGSGLPVLQRSLRTRSG